MTGRNPAVILAGGLLLLASAILLVGERGPELGIPVEVGVAPLIAAALATLVVGTGRRSRPT